ncbi:MAG TPA: hypothetical protein VK509_16845 [Polyangiales bacterium]|nr:hypothetical protein [Polyangiales bacterium]
MNAAPLVEELNRLSAEVARLERVIAEGEGGIADHILLQATLRTQASTRGALATHGVGWALPLSARSTVAMSGEAGRPRNVAQLFSTSTHRIAPPSSMAGHAVLGVF